MYRLEISLNNGLVLQIIGDHDVLAMEVDEWSKTIKDDIMTNVKAWAESRDLGVVDESTSESQEAQDKMYERVSIVRRVHGFRIQYNLDTGAPSWSAASRQRVESQIAYRMCEVVSMSLTKV